VTPILDREYVAAENLNLERSSGSQLKLRLGVAAYPTVDLSKDLPGIPPTDDFSKTKAPPNQVNHETFIKAIEPYFRPFTEDDLTFLRQRVRAYFMATPLTFLGRRYCSVYNTSAWSGLSRGMAG
jgi:hypothetical protein